MSKRLLILVPVVVVLVLLFLLPRGDEPGGPPEPEPAPPDGVQNPTPPGVPPPAPVDAGEAVAAPEPESNEPSEGLCIAGRILRADRSGPVQAYLQAVPVEELDEEKIVELETTTDNRGRFRIEGLAPGRYLLLVEALEGRTAARRRSSR